MTSGQRSNRTRPYLLVDLFIARPTSDYNSYTHSGSVQNPYWSNFAFIRLRVRVNDDNDGELEIRCHGNRNNMAAVTDVISLLGIRPKGVPARS